MEYFVIGSHKFSTIWLVDICLGFHSGSYHTLMHVLSQFESFYGLLAQKGKGIVQSIFLVQQVILFTLTMCRLLGVQYASYQSITDVLAYKTPDVQRCTKSTVTFCKVFHQFYIYKCPDPPIRLIASSCNSFRVSTTLTVHNLVDSVSWANNSFTCANKVFKHFLS